MDKHHHEHHDHSSGFMNGFLLGAIIGAAVIFFLFTEKGKKMLKSITEEGLEGFSELKDLVEEEMNDEEYEEESVDDEPPLSSVPHHVEHSHAEPLQEEHIHEHPAPSKIKRFFKGVKRS